VAGVSDVPHTCLHLSEQSLDFRQVVPNLLAPQVSAKVGGPWLAPDKFLGHTDQSRFFELLSVPREIAFGEIQRIEQDGKRHWLGRRGQGAHDRQSHLMRKQRVRRCE